MRKERYAVINHAQGLECAWLGVRGDDCNVWRLFVFALPFKSRSQLKAENAALRHQTVTSLSPALSRRSDADVTQCPLMTELSLLIGAKRK